MSAAEHAFWSTYQFRSLKNEAFSKAWDGDSLDVGLCRRRHECKLETNGVHRVSRSVILLGTVLAVGLVRLAMCYSRCSTDERRDQQMDSSRAIFFTHNCVRRLVGSGQSVLAHVLFPSVRVSLQDRALCRRGTQGGDCQEHCTEQFCMWAVRRWKVITSPINTSNHLFQIHS